MTMQQTPPETRHRPELEPVEPVWRSTVEWLMGIFGSIALFLGLFISFAGEDQYVGLGGDLSWRVGDITSAWTYGFLIGGAVLILATIGMVLQGRTRR